MLMEMVFSDLEILERRFTRIADAFKGAKLPERQMLTNEKNLLQRIKENLNAGVALREQQLSSEEWRLISGFGFLSTKPLIVTINIGEEQLGQTEALGQQLAAAVSGDHVQTTVICAQMEMDLAQMDSPEEQEFRKELGTGESSLSQMIRISYVVVDQIAFFTVGEDEVRAWEIRKGTVAPKAAGKIHSDLERGFIRAEIISYENLVQCGGLGEGRKRGVLSQEGKDYVMKDGDIMQVLFNV
jgi:ribosome-binding ATPase YchF (GTP1/OBG family)